MHKGAGLHVINEQHQEMRAGDLCMIRPRRDTHIVKFKSPDFTVFNVSFPASTLAEMKLRYFDSKTFWGGNAKLPPLYRMTETERQWLNAAGSELLHASQNRLLLDRFLLNLVCSTGQGLPDPLRACPDWLREACLAVRHPEHFPEGVKRLVAITRRSPEHVSRALKKYTGQTPIQFINTIRLHYAKGQLVTTTRDILAISMDCGFSSLSHFYWLFHRRFGVSPLRYRLKYFMAPTKAGIELVPGHVSTY